MYVAWRHLCLSAAPLTRIKPAHRYAKRWATQRTSCLFRCHFIRTALSLRAGSLSLA